MRDTVFPELVENGIRRVQAFGDRGWIEPLADCGEFVTALQPRRQAGGEAAEPVQKGALVAGIEP